MVTIQTSRGNTHFKVDTHRHVLGLTVRLITALTSLPSLSKGFTLSIHVSRTGLPFLRRKQKLLIFMAKTEQRRSAKNIVMQRGKNNIKIKK